MLRFEFFISSKEAGVQDRAVTRQETISVFRVQIQSTLQTRHRSPSFVYFVLFICNVRGFNKGEEIKSKKRRMCKNRKKRVVGREFYFKLFAQWTVVE